MDSVFVIVPIVFSVLFVSAIAYQTLKAIVNEAESRRYDVMEIIEDAPDNLPYLMLRNRIAAWRPFLWYLIFKPLEDGGEVVVENGMIRKGVSFRAEKAKS